MAGVVVAELPLKLQLVVVDVQACVAVLDQNIGGALLAGDVDDADGVDIQAVKGVLFELDAGDLVGGLLIVGRVHPFEGFARAAVQNHELEIAGDDHLIDAVVVDVVDLVGQVAGGVLIDGQPGGLAPLPEHLAGLHAHGGQAADVAVALLEHALLVLGEDAEQLVRAGQVAEANLTGGAEVLQVEDPAELGLRIAQALLGDAPLTLGSAREQRGIGLLCAGNLHMGKLHGHERAQRDAAVGIAVVCQGDELIIMGDVSENDSR